MAEEGHNSAVNATLLRSLIERVERVNEEIKERNEDKASIFKEIRGHGFDAKIVRRIIALRAMEDHERQEQAALVELYAEALGMQGSLPL